MTNSPGKAHGRPGKMRLSPEEMAVLPQAWEAAWSSEEKKPVVKVKMGVPFPPPPRLSVKEHHARGGFCWESGWLGPWGSSVCCTCATKSGQTRLNTEAAVTSLLFFRISDVSRGQERYLTMT